MSSNDVVCVSDRVCEAIREWKETIRDTDSGLEFDPNEDEHIMLVMARATFRPASEVRAEERALVASWIESEGSAEASYWAAVIRGQADKRGG